MTPDEHAAEAERILRDNLIPNSRHTALIHAILSTRPVALEPLLSADPPPHQPTIVDYDAAVDRATTALWDALDPDMPNMPTPGLVRSWAKVVIDAAGAPTPTSET